MHADAENVIVTEHILLLQDKPESRVVGLYAWVVSHGPLKSKLSRIWFAVAVNL